MGEKVFMSVVGTGNYESSIYNYEGVNSMETRLVQEAMVEVLSKKERFDRIVIVMTEEARKYNWEKYYRENRKTKERIGEEEKGLKERLEGYVATEKIYAPSIPTGSNQEEMNQIFATLYDSINEEDEITVDVTHGFRTIPMQFLAVISYARALKGIKVKKILYGAFEAKENGIVPVFDITIFQNIIDWSTGAKLFKEYGIGDYLKDLAPNDIFASDLAGFTAAIQTSRGKTDTNSHKTSIYQSYKKLKMDIDVESNNALLNPLKKYAVESVKDFDDDDVVENGMATVKWCVEKKLTQQGYTALQETLTTFMCRKFGMSYEERTDRTKCDKIMGACENMLSKGKMSETQYKRYMSYEDEVLINELKKLNIKLERHDIENAKKVTFDVANLSQKLGKKRNDINHFGTIGPEGADKLQKSLKECAEGFKRIYEED